MNLNTDSLLAIAPNNWNQAFRIAWKTYWPLRIILLMIGTIPVILGLSGSTSEPGFSWIEHTILAPWNKFDVEWYLDVARDGYAISDGRAAFHPLFPLLSGILGRILGGQYLLASFIVNDIACLGMLMVFYRLINLDYDASVAHSTIQWFLFIPMGYILLIPYTEALTLCLLGFALWFWRHNRWLAAGLCGCFATLTKQPAIALVLALGFDYLYHHRHSLWHWETLKVVGSLYLIPLGYALFSVYRTLMANTTYNAGVGTLIVSDDLNKFWKSRFGWPWEAIARIIEHSFGQTSGVFWVELALTTATLGVCLYSLRRYRRIITLFGMIQIMLISTIIILLKDPLLSYPRRFMLVIPMFLQLALWSTNAGSKSKYWRIASLALMITLSLAYTMNRITP